jgi:hypothetical protein
MAIDAATLVALRAIDQEWRRLARKKLAEAPLEPDPMGRNLIAHGGMCYFNCAQALRKAVPELETPSTEATL